MVIHPDILISCLLENGAETHHVLRQSESWRIGRGGKCNVTIKQNPYVSAVAFLIRYPGTRPSQVAGESPVTVHVTQRGTAKVLVHGQSDERMYLTAGSQVALQPGETYQVDLLTPVRVASVRLQTPPLATKPAQALHTSNTQTWSIAGNLDTMPPWLDVAALACVIELYPDVCPRLSAGTRATASQTLLLAVEVFLGRSSRAYCHQKLVEALNAARIDVAGGQDKQSRVASYFVNFFPRRKLAELRDRIKGPIQLLATSDS